MVCNFSLDNFIIKRTRSLRKDTDYCTVSVTVGNDNAIAKTQAMGDVDNGTHQVGLVVPANIPDDVPTPVVFSYVIVNNGHSNHADIQKGAEAALAQIGKAGASAVAKEISQPIGDAVGAAIGASIGTAVVPLVGTALGAIAGFVVSEIGGWIFANCDGTVAAGVKAFVSTDLLAHTLNGAKISDLVNHPGTDSEEGCGKNSIYETNTSISRQALTIITPPPPTKTVPDVFQMSPAQATSAIKAAGLVPQFTGPNQTHSWVASQAPAAGHAVGAGSIVKMVLRTGPMQ